MAGFGTIYNIAASAMSANRLRINTIASNIANANTTRTEEGGPYKRRDVVFSAVDVKEPDFETAMDRATLKSVKVAAVTADPTPGKQVYDPGHPDADPKGYITLPNINPVTEMVNMLGASNAYKASAEVASITQKMAASLRTLASRF